MKETAIKMIMTSLFVTMVASANASTSTQTSVDTSIKPVLKREPEPAPAPTPAAEVKADNIVSGTFDFTSNYMFRGVSQSNNLPAAQGGLTVTVPNFGMYLSAWGSNVNFPDPQGNTATVELDTIAGITNNIGDNFSYDINIDRYNYPKSAASYNEFIANATYYFLTAQYAFSSNVYNLHGNGSYYNLGILYDIPAKYIFNVNDVNIKAGVGHYSLQPSTGLRSYNDYLVQLTKTIGIYSLALMWTDTNGRSVDPAPLRDSHLVGTVTASF